MTFGEQYRVKPGDTMDFNQWDPRGTGDCLKKKDVREPFKDNLKRISKLQYALYAEKRQALLIVLQARDTGGKDGTIRRVFGPLNPQGCRVTSFKSPTEEELDHDFLWRVHRAVPAKGMIGIFNRSHYEDVLIVRVRRLVSTPVWSRRYEQINQFEKLLFESGVHILKFYLHISPEEQWERLLARLDDPHKHWKVNADDFAKRDDWDAYTQAYQDALSRCSTEHAPWYIVPADKKWYRNLVISSIVREKLESMNPQFPAVTCDIEALTRQYVQETD